MIISEQQVSLALDYLQTSSSSGSTIPPPDVSPEVLEHVRAYLVSLPECREDRVEEARERFAHALPTPAEIAEKMLGRIISDSLR